MKENLLISFSGGRTSAYMTKLLLDNCQDKYNMIVVFANTGKERQETLEFINRCDIEFGFNTVWIESITNMQFGKGQSFRIVDFKTASRNGEPFEDVIKKHGIPNQSFPHCTRELKVTPINKYVKSMGWSNYQTAIGIRIDELKRVKNKKGYIYPLVKMFPSNKLTVNKWWANQSFNLKLKGYEGNCDMCWKKSKRKLLTLILEKPDMINWWNEMELKYGNYIPESQVNGRIAPITFFRNNESGIEFIEDSKEPFRLATDDFTKEELMYSIPELDFTNGCEESCEAF